MGIPVLLTLSWHCDLLLPSRIEEKWGYVAFNPRSKQTFNLHLGIWNGCFLDLCFGIQSPCKPKPQIIPQVDNLSIGLAEFLTNSTPYEWVLHLKIPLNTPLRYSAHFVSTQWLIGTSNLPCLKLNFDISPTSMIVSQLFPSNIWSLLYYR